MTTPTLRDAQVAAFVKNGIADFVADNWPMRKYTLAEIEAGIREIEINLGACNALTAPEQSTADGGQASVANDWKIDYDNDTGPGDEGFWEWWTVSSESADIRYRADTEEQAKLLLAALITPAAPTSGEPWQPIETAPRDGGTFIGWNGHWRGVARYHEPAYEDDPVWTDERTEYIVPPLTHWMPLPAAPGATPPSDAQSEGAKWVVHQIAGDLNGTSVHGEFDTEEEADAAASVLGDYWAGTDRPALTAAPEKLEGPKPLTEEQIIQGWHDWPNSLSDSGVFMDGVRFAERHYFGTTAPSPHQQAAQPESALSEDEQAAVEFYALNPSAAALDLQKRIGAQQAAQPLIHIAPDARKGKPPCGECHLNPGEVCDICGAKEPQQAAQGGEREAFERWFITLDPAERPGEADAWYVWRASRAAQGGREGLTDEQIDQVSVTARFLGLHRAPLKAIRTFARAIERAHGIGITTPAGDSAASQIGSGGGA